MKQCHQSVENTKIEQQHNLAHDEADANECDTDEAMATARVMSEIDCKCKSESQFAQQHLFEKGLKKFGKEGEAAGFKEEAKQLHNRRCFAPTLPKKLSNKERNRAQTGR